ncbi:hypothetical protein EJB05_35595, partial [Eragrostis curvula]
MAPSKLRQVVGAVKDQTSIGLAKVASGGSAAAELDVAIVKATLHSESMPAEERHIREVLALARCYPGACVSSLSRRLGRTRSWAVALKTLVIVHRLLAASGGEDDDAAFEREVFHATRRGTRVLNMSDFCDCSRADAWDFSAFVRTFAAYLDDRLEYRMQARQQGATRGPRPLREEMYMSPGNRSPAYNDGVFSVRHGDDDDARRRTRCELHGGGAGDEGHADRRDDAGAAAYQGQPAAASPRPLHRLPPRAAKANRVVAVSLFPLVKESVQLYCELTEVMAALIEQFPEMETADCERVHHLFVGLAKDMDDLDAFYAWCKVACVCRHSSATGAPRIEEQDMNATKALPAPEEPPAAPPQEDDNAGKPAQAEPEPLLLAAEPAHREADFLNLKADAMSGKEHGQQLTIALFDGNPSAPAPTGDTFDPSSADWETALVQSASALANQRAELGGGLNMMVLDGMYGHATVASAQAFSGSASSVAMRPPGAPMLALPAPPGASGTAMGADPFAASSVVPPPTYVQMSDLQTKQQLLTAEQMVWRQYGKNGMQGPGDLTVLEQRPHQQPLLPHGSYNNAAYHRSSSLLLPQQRAELGKKLNPSGQGEHGGAKQFDPALCKQDTSQVWLWFRRAADYLIRTKFSFLRHQCGSKMDEEYQHLRTGYCNTISISDTVSWE